jgi:hypothetical protein
VGGRGVSAVNLSRCVAAGLAGASVAAPSGAGAGEPCARIVAPRNLAPVWVDALADLRKQVQALPASDCQPMTLSLQPAGRAVQLVAVTLDERHAERTVEHPGSLVATALGLLMAIPEPAGLPPTPAPESPPSAGTAPPGRVPRSIGLWAGAAAGVRVIAPTNTAVVDVEARADLTLAPWLFPATIRSALATCLGQKGYDCDVYSDVSVGVGVGRRIAAGAAAVDLAFGPSVVWMRMEYDAPLGQGLSVAGTVVALRIDASARVAVPLGKSWALTLTLDAGLAPSLLTTTRLDPPAGATVPDGEPPAFPAWIGGVRLGASGALL